MFKIALQMLFGDRGKYITMVVGVIFATLIMTQQPAILIGFLSHTYSFIHNISLPDIWVMDPDVQFVEEHKPMKGTILWRVKGIAGVQWAVPLFKNFMRAKLPDGSSQTIDLTGLDDATLIGAPYRILQGRLSDLRRKDAIFVDQEAAESRLRIKISTTESRPLQMGDILEINDHRAIVTGIIKSTRNIFLQPRVYTTYSQAVQYSSQNRRHLTYVLVKAKESAHLPELVRKIEQTTHMKAYTSQGFEQANFQYWLNNTGVIINLGITVLLGFIVGTAIVGQTFFNFVQENMKHYAVLKAMGLKDSILARMVMLQAIVIGAVGYGIGVALTSLFGMKVHDTALAFRMPPSLLIFAGIGVLLIISASAFVSIRRVFKVDPSIVFRG